MSLQLFTDYENGRLTALGKTLDISAIEWKAHKDFEGVFMKSVVTADHTDGMLTCLLVRIEPGKKIGLHAHPASIELHEVIAGEGSCILDGQELPYAPGVMGLMPATLPHEVLAGDKGLYLFAKFVPVREK